MLDKTGRMPLVKGEVNMRWREHFEELIGNDGERDTFLGTVGLEIRRERNR